MLNQRSGRFDDDAELNNDLSGDLVDTLRGNIGRVVTIFTSSGGCSGRGFTGLLVRVDCGTCKLITSLPSAPRHPFGFNGDSFDHCDRSRFGSAIVIPIRQIVSCVFNEI
jgi:hypothetical protein